MFQKILKKIKKSKIYKKLFIIKTLKKIQKEKKSKRSKLNLQLKINTSSKVNKVHIIWAILFILALAVLIGLSFLKINTIQIIKTDDTSDITIAYKSVDKFRWDFLFLIKKDDIKKSLMNYQKNLESISINRIPPNTLKIKISSHDTLFKTNLSWKNYLITKNWVLIPTNKENNDIMMLELYSKEKYNFPDYQQILKQNFLENINTIEKKIFDNLLNINIKKIHYYPVEREAHFVISNDTLIIFDLNWDILNQVEKLIVLNKEYFNLAKNWLVYIDLRIKNKVFYCSSENQTQCNKNLEKIYK